MLHNPKFDTAIANEKVQIERVSTVEYNNDAQVWELSTPGGEILATSKDRQMLLDIEVNVAEQLNIATLSIEHKDLVEKEIAKYMK